MLRLPLHPFYSLRPLQSLFLRPLGPRYLHLSPQLLLFRKLKKPDAVVNNTMSSAPPHTATGVPHTTSTNAAGASSATSSATGASVNETNATRFPNATTNATTEVDDASPLVEPATAGSQPVPAAVYENHPLLSKIPRFLRPYTTQFITAPVSHVTAFVVLHEITAIVPLVIIWYVLHQHHDLLMVSALDLPAWAIEKGTKVIDKAMTDWDFGNYSLNDKVRFITEGAYAYVIVKALFPIRLAFSLLGMPFFARWFVLPITGLFKKKPAPKPEKVSIEPHAAKTVEKPRL